MNRVPQWVVWAMFVVWAGFLAWWFADGWAARVLTFVVLTAAIAIWARHRHGKTGRPAD